MGQSYLFVILLALTVATVGAVLMQVVFGLMEVKKRRLAERLGSAVESEYESSYGPIANAAEQKDDLGGLFAKSATVLSFQAKLKRAYPGVVLKRFFFMIASFAIIAAVLAGLGTQSIVAAIFMGIIAGILPFLIVSSKCAKHQK